MMKLKANVNFELSAVRDGKTVRTLDKQSNLILDSGLNGIAARTWANSFTYAVLGTGDAPTVRRSGSITATLVGGTVTSDTAFFSASDEGRSFKFVGIDHELRISSYLTDTTVEVQTILGEVPPDNASATAFSVFHVTDTSLSNETKRSNTYGTDSEDNGTFYDDQNGIVTLKRTFLFSEETAAITYREIGWASSPGGGLFGRALLDSPFPVEESEQVKVSVEVQVAISPITQEDVPNVIGPEFDTTGKAILYRLPPTISRVFSSGSSSSSYGQALLEPSERRNIAMWAEDSELPEAPVPWGTTNPPNIPGWRPGLDASNLSYQPGTFRRVSRVIFSPVDSNGVFYGLTLSTKDAGHSKPHMLIKFDTPQTKENTHRLVFDFFLEWGRVLSD